MIGELPSKLWQDQFAVVVGLHTNGLGVVRSLGRMGVPVVGITDEPHDAFAQSRYCRKLHCEDMNGAGLLRLLLEIGHRASEKPVLFLTLDQSVRLVSKIYREMHKYYRLTMPEPRVVNTLMDKSKFFHWTRSEDIAVPNTYLIDNECDLFKALDHLQFPCILKPSIKTPKFVTETPQKAFLVKDREQLYSRYWMLRQWAHCIILQEWIPGPDQNLIFCLFYCDQRQQVRAHFTGRKVRQYIPDCGTACMAEVWPDAQALEQTLSILERLHYEGVGAIEYKLDPLEKAYKVLELTVGRTEHLFALATANGTNIPYIAYCDLIQQRPKVATRPTRAKTKYVYWRRDFLAAREYMRRGELSVWEWLKSLYGPKEFALFALDDLRPMTARLSAKLDLQRRLDQMRRKMGRTLQRTTRALTAETSGRSQTWAIVVKDRYRVRPQLASRKEHIQAAIDWILRAQSLSSDGGIPRGYSLKPSATHPQPGWQPSYPETSGYLIPTLLRCATWFRGESIRQVALAVADWEIHVQRPNGAIPGGIANQRYGSVIFNTGQVILGWCSAYAASAEGKYLEAAKRAADFVVDVQDLDGAWRRFSSYPQNWEPHAYDTRTAWALAECYRHTGDERYAEAARRNVKWALSHQNDLGWFDYNGLRPKHRHVPLTHTIDYALRGVLETSQILNQPTWMSGVFKAAKHLIQAQRADGALPGRLDRTWKSQAKWTCLTGNAQISIIWLKLFQLTGEAEYLNAARRINIFLQSTQDLETQNLDIRGAIKGSDPIDGSYAPYQYLSWATKFFIDVLLLQEDIEHRL